MIPPRTIDVQVAYIFQLITSEELVAWAVDAIVFGCDSKSLRLLAGLQVPFDREEVDRLFKAVLKDLQIEDLPSEQHIPIFIASTLKAMLNKEFSRKEALQRLSDLYQQLNFDRQLSDFYNLYNAVWDLETETQQWYWRGADRSNIDTIIDEYAANWLIEHKS